MMRPIPDVRLTLVVNRYEAVYSGMVPGQLAGDYAAEELVIDVLPLARRAGARCILAAATGVDAEGKKIELEGRPPVAYDVASLDVGSTVRDLSGAGQAEFGVATRPIERFVREVDAQIEAAAEVHSSLLRLTVVGGGAAGVEVALCAEARLRALGQPARVLLVAASLDLLPGSHAALAPQSARELAAREIEVRLGTRVLSADSEGLVLATEGGHEEEKGVRRL